MAFVAREYEIQKATDYVSELIGATKSLPQRVLRPRKSLGDSSEMAALSFYGIAGCGKSALKRQILDLPDVRKRTITISYDFERSSDTVDVLVELSRKLDSKGCLCGNFNKALSRLSRTSPHYAQYTKPSRRGSLLKDAVSGALPFPLGVIASFGIQIIVDIISFARGNLNDDSREDVNTEESSVSLLAANLKKDIKFATSLHSRPLLFIFDTYEKLSESEKGQYAERKDSWLRELLAMPNVGWIAFGRGPLRDGITHGTPIELDIFTYRNVCELLQKNGIRDAKLAKSVFDASRGLPLFVSIFIDSWKRAVQANKTIKPEEVSSNGRLVETFLRHFDHQDSGRAEMLCLCSCVQKWNRKILTGIDDATRGHIVALSDVNALSFVDVYDDDLIYMHEVAAKAIRLQHRYREKRQATIENMSEFQKSLHNDLQSSGWSDYSWWKTITWLARLQHQSIILSEEADSSEGPEKLENLKIRYANTLDDMGMHKEASYVYRELLNVAEARDARGESVNVFRNGYAIALMGAGYYESAIDEFNLVFEARKQDLGEDNRLTAITLKNKSVAESKLAEDRSDSTLHELALEHKREALFRLEKSSTCDKPRREDREVLSAMKNLAVTLGDLDFWNEAVEIEEELVVSVSSIYGEMHPETLMAYSNLAGSYFSLGKAEDNTQQIEKALELDLNVLGKRKSLYNKSNNPDLAMSLYNVAESYKELGHREQALSYASQSYRMYRALFGDKHPDTRDSLKLLREIEQMSIMSA